MKIITDIEKLAGLKPDQLAQILREQAAYPADTQQAVLMNIVGHSKNSAFGKKYGFAKIRSAAEYQKIVPIGEYEDFKPYIDRMFDGSKDELYSEPVAAFVLTSGTTGSSKKCFPESVTGNKVKKLISSMRSFEINRMLSGKRTDEWKVFTITNTSDYGTNKLGIPVGSASGLALAQTGKISARLAVPAELSKLGGLTSEAQNYCYALFALAEKHVEELVCNNIAHFVKIYEIINSQTKTLLNDIENGSISVEMSSENKKTLLEKIVPQPEWAAELREIFEKKGRLDIKDFWQDFVCVGCWLSSSVGRIAKEYKSLFPENTQFIHWGYGASEAKIDVPTEPGKPCGIPALFGAFYEFRDISTGEVFLLEKLAENKLYELIITTYSGLYRYNLHDLVKVYRSDDGLPQIEFISKSKDKIVVGGRTLYAGQLSDMIEKYESTSESNIRLFQGKKQNDGLALFVEPIGKFDLTAFKTYMEKVLKEAGIELVSVTEYEQGHRNSLYEKVVDGKSVSSTKLPVFIE